MRNYMVTNKKTPVITVVRNDDCNINKPVITFYDWWQTKYGCLNGKRCANPETPQGFADYARYTVDVLEDYIWEPKCNKISEWYEWLLHFLNDEKVLEQFMLLWHEYRKEVPIE